MQKIILLLCGVALAGCGQSLSSTVDNSVGKAADQVGCEKLSSNVWDVVTNSLIQDQALPDSKAVSQAFAKKVSEKSLTIESSKVTALSAAVADFVAYLQTEFKNTPDANQLLATVVGLEVGDHSDDIAINRQKHLDVLISNINHASVDSGETCPLPITETPEPQTPRSVPAMVFGARKVMATAYQSCRSIEMPALDHNTANLRGIIYDGMYEDGIGRKRLIGNLSEVQASHPYLETAYGANCFQVRNNPLIYDYGGKPDTVDGAPLNLFKSNGGTKVLGIDCSGYVFSAIATAGLRIAPNANLKTTYVYGIPARAYMNPSANGLGCFEQVKMGVSGNIRTGDLIAGTGHINLVESIGVDPFGINNAKTNAECDAINSDNFDFVVAQSSTDFEGVGINRVQVRDFLTGHPSFDPGLEDYARQACKARLAGKDVQLARSDLRVVRHKGTPECKASKSVALTNESCILSCPGLN